MRQSGFIGLEEYGDAAIGSRLRAKFFTSRRDIAAGVL
jgi:hypothetical protein